MTALEIDKALTDIVLEKYDECENRLNSTDKSLKMERKAIQIELGMYSLCLRAGLLYHTTGARENTLKHFKSFASRIFAPFPKIAQAYNEANEEERLKIVAALRQEAFMRDQFSNKNEGDYELAKSTGSVDDAFELNIKIKAINEVYRAWEMWRVQNCIYSHMFR